MTRSQTKGARRGFTLIEIMISVAIVGILASIAIPNFIRYQLHVKTSEARTLAGSIITAQTSFAAEFENYANIQLGSPSGGSSILKRPWDSPVCPDTCSRTNPSDCTSFSCIGFEPPSHVFYQYYSPGRLSATNLPAEFAVGVVGDLDGDSRNGSFAYQSSNLGTGFGQVAVPETSCLAGITAGILENCSPANY